MLDPSTGTLALAPRPDVLPGSRREVAAVARLGGADVEVLSGGAATEAAFRREAPRRRILHLATYGVLNKQNPLFSYVDLAAGGAQDGRLEVHEVFGLDLAADLVVLSACQTGLGSGALADVPAGDDWVGLTRAFLHAGAAHVVATLWSVEDWATASLMERFYERYRTSDDPERALAVAQRELLAAPATSHPFYWSAFATVGDGQIPVIRVKQQIAQVHANKRVVVYDDDTGLGHRVHSCFQAGHGGLRLLGFSMKEKVGPYRTDARHVARAPRGINFQNMDTLNDLEILLGLIGSSAERAKAKRLLRVCYGGRVAACLRIGVGL